MAVISQALLLVDGYNIIGAWSYLKETRDRDGLESARRELVEVLINYTAHAGYTTQVVFDSHFQKTPGVQESHTSSLSVYFTAFAQTADTYIEKFAPPTDIERIYQLIVSSSPPQIERNALPQLAMGLSGCQRNVWLRKWI